MNKFCLISKPSFYIGFCLVLALNIEKDIYFKLKSVQSVFSANYYPKQFQKQWQIELYDISLSSISYSSIFACSLPLPPGFANLFTSAKRHHGQPASVLRAALKTLTFDYFTYAILICNWLLLDLYWKTLRSVSSIGPVTVTSRNQQSPCPTSRLQDSTAGIQPPEPLEKSGPQLLSLNCYVDFKNSDLSWVEK